MLHNMTIIRMANATNYEVDEAQAGRLNALWSRTGKDWSYADSVAGLWAYHQTYGREVSRLPGSPVANISILVGRAVSGVYNKVMNFRSLDPRDERTGMTGSGAMDRRAWVDFYDPATGGIDEVALSTEFHRLWQITHQATPVEDTRGHEATVDAESRRLCSLDLGTLMDRYQATMKNRSSKPSTRATATREYVRDPLIVAIGKVRADFRCEVQSCSHPAFMDAGNMPYCEVHHIRPLTEGGLDDLDNVACLCPAHHREIHHGKTAEVIRVGLIELRKVELIDRPTSLTN